MTRRTSDFVKTLFILNDVNKGSLGIKSWKSFQGIYSFNLGSDISLVPQLVAPNLKEKYVILILVTNSKVLPLEIRLLNVQGSDKLHVRIHTNPKNWRITVREKIDNHTTFYILRKTLAHTPLHSNPCRLLHLYIKESSFSYFFWISNGK